MWDLGLKMGGGKRETMRTRGGVIEEKGVHPGSGGVLWWLETKKETIRMRWVGLKERVVGAGKRGTIRIRMGWFEEKGSPSGFGWGGSEIRRVWESNPALQRDRLAY